MPRIGASSLRLISWLCIHTVKSGYLAQAPDGSTAATYALDNETCFLDSSILPNPPPNMMPFDLELTVLIILHACMT